MVARLMASAAYWLTRRAARSSRLQRLAGQSCSAVRAEARATTSPRAAGGKSPRPAGPWGILQAGEAVGQEAGAPQGHGVAATGAIGRGVEVGGVILRR